MASVGRNMDEVDWNHFGVGARERCTSNIVERFTSNNLESDTQIVSFPLDTVKHNPFMYHNILATFGPFWYCPGRCLIAP